MYVDLRGRINDALYAMRDLIKPVQSAVFSLKEAFEISFERPDLLRRETIVTTADTYGADWFGISSGKWLGEDSITEYEITGRTEAVTYIDEHLENLDQGEAGSWADVAKYIDTQVENLNSGLDPDTFTLDQALLEERDREDLKEVPKYPDNPQEYLR